MLPVAAIFVAFLAIALAPLGGLLHPPSRESQPSGRLDAADLGNRIDLNTADAPTLCLLPGLGQPMSERVVQHRAQAPFASVNELRQVSGVGDSILTRITPYTVASHAAP